MHVSIQVSQMLPGSARLRAMRNISRRGFIATSGAALGALPLIRSIDALAQVTNPVFRHGVASGDPLSDRVILWTRVTPKSPTRIAGRVVDRSRAIRSWRRSWRAARSQTGAARDFTVKVDATGLEPGTTYYYRFESSGEQSAIGRTRTLPRPASSRIRLGVVSCSNLPQGYFNAYACLAKRADLDAVLHLGDYLYEYANRQYGDGTAVRPHSGARTRRWSRCRTTASGTRSTRPIRIRRRSTASIRSSSSGTITSSPTTPGGAARRTTTRATKASGPSRRAAAVQAYFEWMPIREDAQTLQPRIYRTFRFGDLADAVHARHAPGRPRSSRRRARTSRTIELAEPSAARRRAGRLARRAARRRRCATRRRWNLLGQQVMFAPQTAAGRARRQSRFVGRLPRCARARVRHGRAGQG